MWKRILWTVFALSILAGVSYAAQEAPPPVKPPEEAAAKDPPDPLTFGPVKLSLKPSENLPSTCSGDKT